MGGGKPPPKLKFMINLLTAAAAAAGTAVAAGGPAVWIGTAVVLALSIVGGLLIKNSQDERERQQAEKLLEESNKIAKEQGVANTENSRPIEEENAWVNTQPNLVNSLTGQNEKVTANDQATISKGNIIDNYMNGERGETQSAGAAAGATSGVIGYHDPNKFYNPEVSFNDDKLNIGIASNPPIPNIETKTDERVTVNTIDWDTWDTLIGEENSTNNNENNKNENEDDQPVYIPSPEDKTEENLEEEIPNTVESEWDKWYKLREEQWAREDAIRKETQDREDTAYQRAIADMKKAGINPNIFGVQPAESGGGITQASMPDMSTITNQMNIDLKELQQLIDQNFQGDENTKDRLLQTFTSILSMVGMIVAFKK